jgi:hypothetical protein
MSLHSHYWKKDLLKRSSVISDKVKHQRWGDEAIMILEQVITLGFYSIQRLLKENLISHKLTNKKFTILKYPALTPDGTIVRSHEVHNHFDLHKSGKTNKNSLFLCHQFLQSHYLEFTYDQKKHPLSIYVSSEKSKNKEVYKIDLKQIIEIFNEVGEDNLSAI